LICGFISKTTSLQNYNQLSDAKQTYSSSRRA
jgi:hypothetical protein